MDRKSLGGNPRSWRMPRAGVAENKANATVWSRRKLPSRCSIQERKYRSCRCPDLRHAMQLKANQPEELQLWAGNKARVTANPVHNTHDYIQLYTLRHVPKVDGAQSPVPQRVWHLSRSALSRWAHVSSRSVHMMPQHCATHADWRAP